MSTSVNPHNRAAASILGAAQTDLHPDYLYWAPQWARIRDAEIGEVEIKRKRQAYLPKLQNHDEQQYEAYLNRAVYYNMTSKTLTALYGTVFQRSPRVSGLPKALVEKSKNITKDGMSLNLLAKTAVKEVLTVARYGMLVDAASDGTGSPYIATYTTENILDWDVEEVNGRYQPVRVVLREISKIRGTGASPHTYQARYRVLLLIEVEEGYLYEQHVYDTSDVLGSPDFSLPPDEIVIPTVRGEPLDYIPFAAIGPFSNTLDVQKPPLLDIVTLNLSHYLSYACLEQGRFFTANPVYTVAYGDNAGESGEYYVGPDVVWELGKDGKAGILEFSGHGLTTLERALDKKEAQISAIGGRLMPGSTSGAAESDNSLKLKEQNENTLLLNIADTIDEGFTQVLAWWADWSNASSNVIARISFEVNRDFLLKDIGAREFRAIHQMYSDGIIPVTAVYEYLRKAEVIPDWMSAEEYMKLLNDSDQFPHMVDVLARMKNFPDAKSFHEYRVAKEAELKGKEVNPAAGEPSTPPVPEQARQLREGQKRAQQGKQE